MAEQAPNPPETKPPAGGVSTRKALLVLLAILALEAGAIGLTVYFSGGPAEAKGESADTAAAAATEEADRVVELLVTADKFPNMQTGRHFLYDTEVHITVRQRHSAAVERELESMRAQVSAAMATIIRKAHPAYFREATLATLTRQVRAMLDELLGADPDGESYIQQVLITRCNPFRADF